MPGPPTCTKLRQDGSENKFWNRKLVTLKKQMQKIFSSVFPMFSKKVLIFGLFWAKNRGGLRMLQMHDLKNSTHQESRIAISLS